MEFNTKYSQVFVEQPAELGESLIELGSYIDERQRLLNFMDAGERLMQSRRDYYDSDKFDDVEDIGMPLTDEDADDLTTIDKQAAKRAEQSKAAEVSDTGKVGDASKSSPQDADVDKDTP